MHYDIINFSHSSSVCNELGKYTLVKGENKDNITRRKKGVAQYNFVPTRDLNKEGLIRDFKRQNV